MFLSAGYELAKKIFAHGFFTIDGQKISKSIGNAIDPLAIAQDYGVDALRYFLFKEIPFGNDGDFSFERLKEVYNADLANGLGNLVSRVAKLCETANLNLGVRHPSLDIVFEKEYQKYLEKLEFQRALEWIWEKIREADKTIDQEKPWESVKADKPKAAKVLTKILYSILVISTHLKPLLPETAEKIEKQFAGPKIKSEKPLFPRKN